MVVVAEPGTGQTSCILLNIALNTNLRFLINSAAEICLVPLKIFQTVNLSFIKTSGQTIKQCLLSKLDNCYSSHEDYCNCICSFVCYILTTPTPVEFAFHKLSQSIPFKLTFSLLSTC